MEREEACEGEECGTLKLRSRKGKIGNPAPKGAAVVMVEEEEEAGGELERCVYLDRDQGKVVSKIFSALDLLLLFAVYPSFSREMTVLPLGKLCLSSFDCTVLLRLMNTMTY